MVDISKSCVIVRYDARFSFGSKARRSFSPLSMASPLLSLLFQLKVGGVRQRLHVPYFSSADALRAFVREVFADDSLTQEKVEFGTRLIVHGAVAATFPASSTAR